MALTDYFVTENKTQGTNNLVVTSQAMVIILIGHGLTIVFDS